MICGSGYSTAVRRSYTVQDIARPWNRAAHPLLRQLMVAGDGVCSRLRRMSLPRYIHYMIVPIGKPGSRERVEALRAQYDMVLASGEEVSPFGWEG